METKIYILEDLGCANCAAKMEDKINAHPAVASASITFATRQLRLTAEDPDALIPEVEKIVRAIEAQVKIRPRKTGHDHGHHEHCGCGHDHGHHEHCGCGHDHGHHEHCTCGHDHEHHHHDHDHGHHHPGNSLLPILAGGGLFLLGLLLELFHGSWAAYGSALLFLAGYVVLGWQVLNTAAGNLLRGHIFDENFLMSLATLGAMIIGEFPEAVGVMLFYRIGTYFEEKAVERSRSQIMEAVDLRPETVTLVHEEGFTTVPAEQAKPGDVILIRPGDRIPLDGVVLTGESAVDTAPITGEPVPVSVRPGDSLISGCLNTTGQLTLLVEKSLSESMVTRILSSVESAAASKPKLDRFITRFARIYTPIVVAVAALTALIPSLITGDWNYWIYTALSFLVMSCPCALVLSVPLAFFSGIGVGSRRGILFKGGLSMEAMTRVRAVVMDKTGTLTRGEFRVRHTEGGDELLALCASCEQQSTHPIARSIVAAAKERNLPLRTPEKMEELPGRGIRAEVNGEEILCGSRRLLEEAGISLPEEATAAGTLVHVACAGRWAGSVLISDILKDDAPWAVARLKEKGFETAILTGDAAASAEEVARQAGVGQVHARLLPHEKLERLRRLRQENGPVMFVGDGINDAPVLAGADVGCAMGSGADAAIEAADVVFMTDQVSAIPEALEIARATNRIAWQNVVFALAIKFAVMVLGLLGHASMWLAVFADSGVAMLCVLNAIRLLYRKK